MQIKTTLAFLFFLFSFGAFSLNTPTNLYPQNGASSSGFSAFVSAYTVSTATGYEFYIDTVSTLNSGWLKHDTSVFSGWSTPDLKIGKTYYWKIRAYKPNDTSAWSATLSFTVTSTQIAFQQPNTGTSGNLRMLVGNVNGGTANTIFQYEADTTPLFNSPLHSVKSYPYLANGFSDSALFDFGRKIYWRERAWSLYGDTTAWSPVLDYTIIKQALVNWSGLTFLTDPQYVVNWNDPYLTGAEVQVDTSANFNSTNLVTHTVAAGIALDTIRNLMFGGLYHIRIRNTYAGKFSDWSEHLKLQIHASYNFSSPSYPGLTGYPYNGLCSWRSGQGYNTQFQMYEDDQYTLLLKDTITSSYFYSYPEMLKFSTQYYVRIRMFHELDTTPWKASSFIVNSGAPSIYGINNNEANVSVRPTFQLRKESWVTGLVLEIDTGKIYTANHSSFYIKVDSFKYDNFYYHYADTSLLYNQQYYARVYALKGDDTTGASLISFKTASAPLNYYPPNYTIGTGTSTNGLVKGITGSTYIEWETDTSDLFNSPLHENGIDRYVPDNFTPQYVGVSFPEHLKFHSTYYWRSRCINRVDTGEWSDPFHFLTTQDVWGISPAHKAVSQPLTPTLEWGIQGSSSSLRYQYIVSTDSGFAGATVITLPANSSSRVIINCQFATTYYWKGRAYNPIDTSRWSQIFSFTTIPLPAVGKPTLQVPSNGATNITPGTVSLFWTTAANANLYEAEVASDVNFTTILANGSSTGTGIYFSGAEPSKRYYWRVRGAYDANTKGAWTAPFWFQTTVPVGMEDVSPDIRTIIFPNPADDQAMIRSTGLFQVTVTDLHGRVVKDEKGSDELILETSDLNTGVYFISVQSAEKMLVQKLVISR
jgi:hypothetical protein